MTAHALPRHPTPPDYATAPVGLEQAEAVWCADHVTVRASLGAVNLLPFPRVPANYTRVCRFPDAIAAAFAAADGEPVLWLEYRAISLGTVATRLGFADDPALWPTGPDPQLGFDILDSTFDLNRVQGWLSARHTRRPALSIIERRVWTYLSAPGPWIRQRPPTLAPWSQR
ncbi:hypothetical protein [Nocardia sp. IFM 10818]